MSSSSLPAYEKLGAFYLGRRVDPVTRETLDEDVLYDAKDLTTHGLCVGMTGSGKTGLCISLLEEALLDGVPVLAIDPKGDLSNLLLTFPNLAPEDFRPWIDPQDALRKGRSSDEEAEAVAHRWRAGLAEWGQDGARIERLRAASEATIYTPGSTAGRPLSVLGSLALPPPEVRASSEALRDRIEGSVSGLLSLIGEEGDPLTSRPHVLLSQILSRAYAEGRNLDLPTLVRTIMKPEIERVGVLDLETFYPEKERNELALKFNNVLASPGFAAWLSGDPLDIGKLLRTEAGKPRLTILSIAHLSDHERMFFVTLFLGEVVSWMRTQSGTGSLRALLYMDEVFGFLPPVAEPPSKRPLLVLLKQARAFGVGVVLATQNPVDVDYKALSNCGTWWLGRLQTERDKARVIDGLQSASLGAAQAFDRQAIEERLSSLSSRQFVMNNVHDDGPIVMQTRWALSYLRGPLTLNQLAQLQPPPPASEAVREAESFSGQDAPNRDTASPPALPPGLAASYEVAVVGPERLVYVPWYKANVQLHYADGRRDIDLFQDRTVLCPLVEGSATKAWKAMEMSPREAIRVSHDAEPGASFEPLLGNALAPASLRAHPKAIKAQLYRSCTLDLPRCPALGLVAEPWEDRERFAGRVAQASREARDLELEKLRDRYAPRLSRLEERIRKAEAKVEVQKNQVTEQGLQTIVSLGTSLLGAMFGGRRSPVTGASRAIKGAGRVAKERQDVARAEDDLLALRTELDRLNEEFEQDTRVLSAAVPPEIEVLTLRPRKSDLVVDDVELLFRPYRVVDGARRKAWS